MKRTIGALFLLIALAGCGGTMKGVVRGEQKEIQINYEQGLDRDFYSTSLDGENFEGQAIDAGATTGVGTVLVDGQIGTVTTYTGSGNFIAVLTGDRGSTMRCQMNYADSSGFTTLGGVGICQHSDGRIIDVTW